jgi:hypothetical protein
VTRTDLLRIAATAAWVVVIALLASERRIVRALRRADATGPERAAPLTARTPVSRFRLRRLIGGGAVVAAGDGRFYLDRHGFARYRRSRRRRALVMLSVALPLIALLWWMNGSR